jgi:hypothetical protein
MTGLLSLVCPVPSLLDSSNWRHVVLAAWSVSSTRVVLVHASPFFSSSLQSSLSSGDLLPSHRSELALRAERAIPGDPVEAQNLDRHWGKEGLERWPC